MRTCPRIGMDNIAIKKERTATRGAGKSGNDGSNQPCGSRVNAKKISKSAEEKCGVIHTFVRIKTNDVNRHGPPTPPTDRRPRRGCGRVPIVSHSMMPWTSRKGFYQPHPIITLVIGDHWRSATHTENDVFSCILQCVKLYRPAAKRNEKKNDTCGI